MFCCGAWHIEHGGLFALNQSSIKNANFERQK